jgi:protein-arginine kinase activator protein McsA
MICDRCHEETYFLYGRIELGKRILLCYECAKGMDREDEIDGRWK